MSALLNVNLYLRAFCKVLIAHSEIHLKIQKHMEEERKIIARCSVASNQAVIN